MGGSILNMINFLYDPQIHMWLRYVIYPELWIILKKIRILENIPRICKIWKIYRVYFQNWEKYDIQDISSQRGGKILG